MMSIRVAASIGFICVLGVLCSFNIHNSSSKAPLPIPTISIPIENAWVDSIFSLLSTDEKIGQLFMIRAHSDLGDDHVKSVTDQIKKNHVGGLCFFQGTPEKQAALTNTYQELTNKVPLMVAMDAEWGLGMRHKEHAMSFPKQMTLGAIDDIELIYKMGSEIGRQLKRIGVHINFAPVVDINNNPFNPVINERSFGEDRKDVTVKSYMYMLGLQDEGIMACAKHYPGHGDTDIDSHFDLPRLSISQNRLDSLELYPFRMLSRQGLQSIMTAHLQIPVWESDSLTPASLSQKAILSTLIGDLGFEGLIFTDGLEMKGVQKHFALGKLEVMALLAGNDILLLPQDISKAFSAIKEALTNGVIDMHSINIKVKKILGAKYRMGLYKDPKVILTSITSDLHSNKAKALQIQLHRNALTCFQTEDDLPFLDVHRATYASLALGAKAKNTFQKNLEKFSSIKNYIAPLNLSDHRSSSLIPVLKKYDRVIISLHDMSRSPQKNFGINEQVIQLITDLDSLTEVVVVLFGNPYSLQYLKQNITTVVAYEDNQITQREAAQALFGTFAMHGKLPVTASSNYPKGAGQKTSSLNRLYYGPPEMVYLHSDSLKHIDALVQKLIQRKAAPGCQVLVAKKGSIVYHKSFGHFTYARKRRVRNSDLYDIASITKTASATLAIMKMVDDSLISLTKPIRQYIPGISTTNKANMTLYDIMSHHAGLIPFINFYTPTIDTKENLVIPIDYLYSERIDNKYCIQVAKDMYLCKEYVDTIWNKIYNSDLRKSNNYRYSDLGFYMIADLVQNVTGMSLDDYVKTHFYDPLGLTSITYKPLKYKSSSHIVPSEDDHYFRNQKLQGHVHDMGAAMLGGVSGHAGLFSNAYDLAIIYQMLLNKGYYGGIQYISEETIRLFTSRHHRSQRRGIGFDMKQLDTTKVLNMSEYASEETFGHMGFTGTVVWADPKEELIFVFLSNRTFPTMKNNLLGRENYRPKIQSVPYKSIIQP